MSQTSLLRAKTFDVPGLAPCSATVGARYSDPMDRFSVYEEQIFNAIQELSKLLPESSSPSPVSIIPSVLTTPSLPSSLYCMYTSVRWDRPWPQFIKALCCGRLLMLIATIGLLS